MPLLKFIGFIGLALGAVAIPIGLIGALIVSLISRVGDTSVDATEKKLYRITFTIKCFELWIYSSLIVLGAAYFAKEDSGYYWAAIFVGSILLVFFKCDCIRNAERDVLIKATQRWGDIRFARADVNAGPMPRLWRHEMAMTAIAFLYVYIAGIFNSLVNIEFLESALTAALRFLEQHNFLIVFCVIGWLAVFKYLFYAIFGAGLFFALLKRPNVILEASSKEATSNVPQPSSNDPKVTVTSVKQQMSLGERFALNAVKKVQAKYSCDVASTDEKSDVNQQSLRVVILDNEEAVRNALTFVLRAWYRNVEVLAYADGQNAWNELSSRAPDLLITDMRHPLITGQDLLNRLAGINAKYPILVVSAGLIPNERGELMYGNSMLGELFPELKISCLSKPYNPEHLKAVIQAVLQRQIVENS